MNVNKFIVWETAPELESLVQAAASRWVTMIKNRPPSPLPFTVALSGGRPARPLYEAVVQLTKDQESLWHQVEFFFADERWVPHDHPESNYRIAQQYLFDPLHVPTRNRHGLYIGPDRDYACYVAQADLVRLAPASVRGQPVLDLLILGMGEDGHIASIFPDTPPEVAESQRVYVPVDAPKPPPERISLTLPVMQEAREAWVLIVGDGKEEALRRSIDEPDQTPLGRLLLRRAELGLPTRIWTTTTIHQRIDRRP